MSEYTMSVEEREAFLRGVHVGVISVERPGRAPLTIPIWYDVNASGEIVIQTDSGSSKHRAIEAAGTFSFCVQDEAPPYKYVTVEGPVAGIEHADFERDLRPIARRYLGIEGGDAWLAQTHPESDTQNVVIRMRPERWLTADFGKAAG